MRTSLSVDAATGAPGFQWAHLVILLVVAVVAVPLYQRLRRSLSRSRRERWAREDAQDAARREAAGPDAPGDR